MQTTRTIEQRNRTICHSLFFPAAPSSYMYFLSYFAFCYILHREVCPC